MKFTKLLVMSALWLVGLSANAADLIERTAPEAPSALVDVSTIDLQQPAEFELGSYYVIYNVGAQQFFTEGNAWGTQASLGDGANLSYFSLPNGKTLADAALLFNDFSPVKNAWKLVFFDSATQMYVDLGSQANFYWQVVPVEGKDKTYYLQASPSNPNYNPNSYTGYVGVAEGAAAGSPLEPFLTEGWIEWQFFGVPEWDEYAPLKQLYEKSQELKTMIEKAEAAGINVNAAVEVYNNLQSTVEEMAAAIEALEATLADNIANATGQNPQDASAWIVNGTFDTVGDFTGWSTDKGKFGAGGETSTNAEVYGSNAFDINQDITVKYPGLYLFGVKGFYRAGSADDSYKRWSEGSEDARLARYYVTIDGQTTEAVIDNIFDNAPTAKPAHGQAMSSNGYWIPNYMTHANEFFHKDNLYGLVVPIEVSGSDVAARIGVKKETATSYDTWSIYDDFTLIFCGAGEDRWVGYAKTLAANYPTYQGANATQKYLDAYNEIKNNPQATDKASAEAYIANLLDAKKVLDENIALWKNYEDSVTWTKDVFLAGYVGNTTPAVQALYNYVNSPRQGMAAVIIQQRALDNDGIKAETAKLCQMVQAVKDGVEVAAGSDVTSFLTNPAFDTDDWTGWTKEAAAGGNVQVTYHCCEAWNNAGFDIYQEVKEMPVGVYEISVQGFYRYGRGQDAYNKFNNGEAPENSPTYIYMNANTTSFMNIFNEPKQITDVEFYKNPDTNYAGYTKTVDGEEVTYYFPDGMSSAERAFTNDMFKNSAFGAVVSKEDVMRLGVKGQSNQLNDSWVIFDNFKLTYWGKQADKVNIALEEALKEMKAFKTSDIVGANVEASLQKAIADAETALQQSSQDGEVMFEALVALYDVKNQARESAVLMQKLAAVADSLGNKISAVPQDWLDLTLVRQADELVSEVNISMDPTIGVTMTDEQVPGKIDELHAYMEIVDNVVALSNAYDALLEEMGKLDDADEDWPAKADALFAEIDNKKIDGSFTAEELVSYVDQIEYLIAIKNVHRKDMADATDANPYDATEVIKTPNFEKADEFDPSGELMVNSIDGWKGTDGYNFGNDDTQKAALALEFYAKTFDIYQTLKGLPAGTYEVKADAFQRPNNADALGALLYARAENANDTVDNHVMLKQLAQGGQADSVRVLKDVDGDLMEVVAGSQIKIEIDAVAKDSVVVPNDMVSSVAFFALASKPYSNSVIAKIEEGDDLRIGIKTLDGGSWVIMDNFELWYYGTNSSKKASGDTTVGIEKLAGNDKAAVTVLRTEFFTVNGIRTQALRKGLVIVRQIMSDGSVVTKKLTLK